MTSWLGKWRLIPELSHYATGDPPEAGHYDIRRDGEGLSLAIRWTADGEVRSAAFSAVPDGRLTPIETPRLDGFTLTALSDAELESRAVAGGVDVSHAIRRVSDDRRLMCVVQSATDEVEGWRVASCQIYERIGDD